MLFLSSKCEHYTGPSYISFSKIGNISHQKHTLYPCQILLIELVTQLLHIFTNSVFVFRSLNNTFTSYYNLLPPKPETCPFWPNSHQLLDASTTNSNSILYNPWNVCGKCMSKPFWTLSSGSHLGVDWC